EGEYQAPSSNKTRIETNYKPLPPKGAVIIRHLHPTKQGLKLYLAPFITAYKLYQAPSSNKTRIETSASL
ncbi:hypothetical protein, partial [Desulfobacula sp.]